MTLTAVIGPAILALGGLAAGDARPGPGDTTRHLVLDGMTRSYHLHIPPGYDPEHPRPTPLILALHPLATTGRQMVGFCGLNATADREGFVVVYPEGTGPPALRNWNEGGSPSKTVDDVRFLAAVLDDVASVVAVDPRRIYATGMSNGAMMCYRIASELSDRIAAIAAVAGTMAVPEVKATRPVPILHFHGTADTIVPFDGPSRSLQRFMKFRSVEDTIRAWALVNGTPETPETVDLPDLVEDETTVQRRRYGPGREGAEIVVYVIQNGGHTWPGREGRPSALLGRSTREIDANALIWEFFQAHPMPDRPSVAAESDGQGKD